MSSRNVGSILACLVAICISASSGFAQTELSADFTSGEKQGQLQVLFENAEFAKEGEHYHLAIRPGGWIQATFDTSRRQGEVLIELVARTQGATRYAITLNDETIYDEVAFEFSVYTSTGHDLSRKVVKGKNVVRITVIDAAGADLWLRELRVSSGYRGLNPWIVFAGLTLLSIAICRYVFFAALWRNGRGLDAIWSTRIALIGMVACVFLAYLYVFGASHGLMILVAAGVGAALLLAALLAFTRA